MLNPDGATAWTRRNAQNIDINRDALGRQSPEGRLLWGAVDRFHPRYGFNLHNQNSCTAVNGRPAAVSLLVPPPSADPGPSEQLRRAAQVAALFRSAVEPACPGMISRYDADFMPRCFGENLQQHGVTTLLVEAGGWHDWQVEPLTKIHWTGLVTALHGIATGDIAHAEPAHYESLPRSDETLLFDLLLRDVEVISARGSYRIDIGIRHCRVRDMTFSIGTVEEIGDLRGGAGQSNMGACQSPPCAWTGDLRRSTNCRSRCCGRVPSMWHHDPDLSQHRGIVSAGARGPIATHVHGRDGGANGTGPTSHEIMPTSECRGRRHWK